MTTRHARREDARSAALARAQALQRYAEKRRLAAIVRAGGEEAVLVQENGQHAWSRR